MYARAKLLDPVPVWYGNSFLVELTRIDRPVAGWLSSIIRSTHIHGSIFDRFDTANLMLQVLTESGSRWGYPLYGVN